MYAQTNIQLYNQLVRDGYAPDDLVLIRRAHELAVQLFAGQYRPSGKTFMDHAIGTASIIHEVQGKPALTAAGLLHSAYSNGDFGLSGRMSAGVRSRRVTDSAGSEVEVYVRRYNELPWSMRSAPELLDRIDGMTTVWRDVVSLRVANEVEDHLNGGTLYCYGAARHKQRLEQRHELLAGLAQRLGLPALQQAVDRVFAECAGQDVVPELLQRVRRKQSYRILPGSCRRSGWLFLYDRMMQMRRYVERRTRIH